MPSIMAMSSVEFTLQLLPVIFTGLGIIVAIGGMDRRWSFAAVIYDGIVKVGVYTKPP